MKFTKGLLLPWHCEYFASCAIDNFIEEIYVKEIEKILAKRDKALRNAEERDEEEREEEILQIHTTLLDDMIEVRY